MENMEKQRWEKNRLHLFRLIFKNFFFFIIYAKRGEEEAKANNFSDEKS